MGFPLSPPSSLILLPPLSDESPHQSLIENQYLIW